MVSSLLARCIIVTIGTLYPGYRSYKALIKADLREVVNCLRYWIVFSIFIACETFTDILLSWFPFYYWIKICLVLWIVSPTGATFLFKRFIQPILKEREQDIDRLIEETRQRGYTALLDLTNKGFRYASNMFLNTAVLGQSYLGEHLKRSLSTSDIHLSEKKSSKTPPTTLKEESDEETDSEFTNRLKEDRKYLAKTNPERIVTQTQHLIDETTENLDEFEMNKVMTRRTRTKNSNENVQPATSGKRGTKRGKTKVADQRDLSSNEIENDDEHFS